MIRKAVGIFRKVIIVVLLLATVLVGMAWLVTADAEIDLRSAWAEPESLRLQVAAGELLITHRNDRTRYDDPSFLRKFGPVKVGCVVFGIGTEGGRAGSRMIYVGTITFVRAPLWSLIFLFAAYPTIAFGRGPLRRWRRPPEGLCHKCGYDLRGTPERCPECGTEVEAP